MPTDTYLAEPYLGWLRAVEQGRVCVEPLSKGVPLIEAPNGQAMRFTVDDKPATPDQGAVLAVLFHDGYIESSWATGEEWRVCGPRSAVT